MIAKVLITFGVLFAAPFCMGLIPARFMPGGRRKKNPVLIYLAGFFLTLAVFQLIAVPIILMKPWGFPIIVKLYSGALILLSAAGLFFGRNVLGDLTENGRKLWEDRRRPSVETALYWILAGGLVLFQIYMAYTRASFDGDDAYYVAQSVIAEQSDVLYRILPYTALRQRWMCAMRWLRCLYGRRIWQG